MVKESGFGTPHSVRSEQEARPCSDLLELVYSTLTSMALGFTSSVF
jgi:hypothetical protein